MSPRNWLLVKGAVLILLLWGVVGIVVKVAGSMKPTPTKIARFVQKNPLDEISDPEERKLVIGKIAEMMNQLEPNEMRELEEMGDREARRQLMTSMSPEEQWFFMEKRMGRAFSQMMLAFNDMERDERKRMVERALSEIRKNESNQSNGAGDGRSMEDADPEMVEKIANAGMEAYFRDASAETKMDLAPVMEEMQKIMSAPGRGFHSRRRSK